jgi:hypothetical protein
MFKKPQPYNEIASTLKRFNAAIHFNDSVFSLLNDTAFFIRNPPVLRDLEFAFEKF